MTYDLLDSTTLASSASSVTFSSISQDYRDLILVVNAEGSTSSTSILCTLNGDSGANYSHVNMLGSGSSATSSSASAASQIIFGRVQSGVISSQIGQFMDYSATDKHKTVLQRVNKSDQFVYAQASRWANTDAITSVSLAPSSGDFASGSTFYLFGISA